MKIHDLGTALRRSKGPAGETVGDVGGVAGGAATAVVEVAVVGRAAVVDAGGGVELAAAVVARVSLGRGEGLLEAVAGRGAAGAVADHLGNLAGRAGVEAGAAAGAVVRLHEAGVADAVVRGGHADAALALLHDNGEDEALVDARLAGHGVDGVLDVANLGGRVLGAPAVPAARLLHQRHVGVPELVKGAPGAHGGPALAGRAVALVKGVGVAVAGNELGGGRGDGSCKGSGGDAELGIHDEVLGEV